MSDRTGRQALIEQFLADGMTYMFGNPGTVEQGFLDALGDYPGLRYILALQESIAVGIADGYARASKRPALVQLHSGVGLGNGVGMMYQAMRGHAPLVIIAGDAGVRYDAMDAQMAADLVGIARPVTKWSARVTDPSSLLRMVRRAVKIAATPPMGPVFLALPMDVLDAANDEDVVPSSVPITRVTPEGALVARAAAILAGASRPLIIVGDGVAASGAQVELVRLAETLGAEVWGADCSEVNIPQSHPMFQGSLGHMFGEVSKPVSSSADAVLICGTYVFPEVFPSLSGVFGPGARVIHVDLDSYEIAKNFPVELGLVGDPKLTLAAIADALDRAMTPDQCATAGRRGEQLAGVKEARLASQRSADLAAREHVPLRMSRFAQDLAERLSKDAVIFDEALTSSPELTRYLVPDLEGRYFQTRGGSLGVGIPGAIGLKLAYPDKPVFGFTGDGGSMYTIQALWTAAHHEVDAKFVVCNNGGYKLLKLNIQQYWRERSIPDHGFPSCFEITGPDIRFDVISRGMGVPAVRVERPEDVGPAIEEALGHRGPFLIDLVVDGSVPGHAAPCKCGQ
jgi:benzoylformate decarboxylase